MKKNPNDLPPELVELCKSVTAKRPKTVIDHILEHGFITTEDLKEKYGYDHPPRAVRDARECGIPIETFTVESSHGRKIAAYRFGKFENETVRKLFGRTGLSKRIKAELIERYGSKCFIYLENMDEKDLQIDHRVPFEVGGDEAEAKSEDFMLLCSSANRAKSWSCEHCANWNERKDRAICQKCYWAFPENYSHVAMTEIRRIDIIWRGEETKTYEAMKEMADKSGKHLPDYVKEIIKRFIK